MFNTDDDDVSKCPKCGGLLKDSICEKTAARETLCTECPWFIVHGFGQI